MNQAMVPSDLWHPIWPIIGPALTGRGYLPGRDLKCIVMHDRYGEQLRVTCGIDVLREEQEAA